MSVENIKSHQNKENKINKYTTKKNVKSVTQLKKRALKLANEGFGARWKFQICKKLQWDCQNFIERVSKLSEENSALTWKNTCRINCTANIYSQSAVEVQ